MTTPPHLINRWVRLPSQEFNRALTFLAPGHRNTILRIRSALDLQYFAETFFADHCRDPWNELHHYLFRLREAMTEAPLTSRSGAKDIIMAPRCSAKSTLMSLIFPLHAMLLGREPYIVLVSATQAQADGKLQNLYAALAENDALHTVFALALKKLKKSGSILLLNDCRMDFYSSSAEIRGLSHRGHRPTWIILDDVERGDRIDDFAYRERTVDWFNEVIANLGAVNTHITLVGTQLHPESLPIHLSQLPGYTFRRFSSVITEADDQTLWSEWRKILNDRENEDRSDAAREFFEENRDVMLRGASVLWPEKYDYYQLMTLRETIGLHAFDKEQQNNPWADDKLIFSSIPRRTFRHDGNRQQLTLSPLHHSPWSTLLPDSPQQLLSADSLSLFGYLDPALGGENGDYACIVVAGKDDKGLVYILDAWLDRCSPSQQIIKIYDLFQQWRFTSFGIEANGFQAVLAEACMMEQEHRRRTGQKYDLPLTLINHKIPKRERVVALEPLLRNGWLLFNETLPPEFVRQLVLFPTGDHDDGPDALAACVNLARVNGFSGNPATVKRTQTRNTSY